MGISERAINAKLLALAWGMLLFPLALGLLVGDRTSPVVAGILFFVLLAGGVAWMVLMMRATLGLAMVGAAPWFRDFAAWIAIGLQFVVGASATLYVSLWLLAVMSDLSR